MGSLWQACATASHIDFGVRRRSRCKPPRRGYSFLRRALRSRELVKMMQGGDRTPTLEEAGLPEFRGATLYLASKSAQETDDDDKDVFVDIVDLSRHSDKDDEPKESQSESRRRSTYPQLQSPAESDILYSATTRLGMNQGYFSSRDSMLRRAVHDCKSVVLQEGNDSFLGAWLLTLVDHWDNEKERLVLLSAQSLFIFKYDFIALSLLDYDRISLSKMTQLTIGNLDYPSRSITPKVQQLANRVSSFLRDCLQQLGSEAGRGGGLLNISSTWRNGTQVQPEDNNLGDVGQREREGARISWNVPAEPRLTQMWNPWSKDIPWIVFVSHPLLAADQHNVRFDVQDFISNLRDAVQSGGNCLVEYRSILMESYVGLPALVHNYGQFGYYKNRGKISF